MMERLTFDGNFCDISQCRELPCPYNNNCTQRKVWEKLKAYEDTGLTPEEVNDVMAKAKLASAFGVAAERLRELAEADKAGRLVVLPEPPKGTLPSSCRLLFHACGLFLARAADKMSLCSYKSAKVWYPSDIFSTSAAGASITSPRISSTQQARHLQPL